METTTTTNEFETECYLCGKPVAAGEGVPPFAYYRDRFEHAECHEKRLADEKRAKAEKLEDAQIMYDLLPTLRKFGKVTHLAAGVEAYTTYATVTIGLVRYRVELARVTTSE